MTSEDLRSEADELVELAQVLGRSLRVSDGRLQPTLDAIVTVGAELTGFQAGLAVLRGRRLTPQAATDEPPHALDIWQQKTQTGPCIDAADRQEPVLIADTRTEDRWDGFGARATELGVISMLCFPLRVDDRCVGTLSLYADRSDAFTAQDERAAMVCASLAAVALAGAIQSENLGTALANRDLIGQAKGILVERRRITPDRAFGVLADVSQRRNVKLNAVAAHLVETGELLGEGR